MHHGAVKLARHFRESEVDLVCGVRRYWRITCAFVVKDGFSVVIGGCSN